jgi:hypothetical protein
MRRGAITLRLANAIALAGLATGVALEPTAAFLFQCTGAPLLMALFAGHPRAWLLLRGAATGANALCALPCAMLLLAIAIHFAQAPGEVVKTLQALGLFVPLLALYGLNVRSLVGSECQVAEA